MHHDFPPFQMGPFSFLLKFSKERGDTFTWEELNWQSRNLLFMIGWLQGAPIVHNSLEYYGNQATF